MAVEDDGRGGRRETGRRGRHQHRRIVDVLRIAAVSEPAPASPADESEEHERGQDQAGRGIDLSAQLQLVRALGGRGRVDLRKGRGQCAIHVAAAQVGQHVVLVDGLPVGVGQVRVPIARPGIQLDLAVALAGIKVEHDREPVIEALAADAVLVHERDGVSLREVGRVARGLDLGIDHDLGAGACLDGCDGRRCVLASGAGEHVSVVVHPESRDRGRVGGSGGRGRQVGHDRHHGAACRSGRGCRARRHRCRGRVGRGGCREGGPGERCGQREHASIEGVDPVIGTHGGGHRCLDLCLHGARIDHLREAVAEGQRYQRTRGLLVEVPQQHGTLTIAATDGPLLEECLGIGVRSRLVPGRGLDLGVHHDIDTAAIEDCPQALLDAFLGQLVEDTGVVDDVSVDRSVGEGRTGREGGADHHQQQPHPRDDRGDGAPQPRSSATVHHARAYPRTPPRTGRYSVTALRPDGYPRAAPRIGRSAPDVRRCPASTPAAPTPGSSRQPAAPARCSAIAGPARRSPRIDRSWA